MTAGIFIMLVDTIAWPLAILIPIIYWSFKLQPRYSRPYSGPTGLICRHDRKCDIIEVWGGYQWIPSDQVQL